MTRRPATTPARTPAAPKAVETRTIPAPLAGLADALELGFVPLALALVAEVLLAEVAELLPAEVLLVDEVPSPLIPPWGCEGSALSPTWAAAALMSVRV